MRQTLGTIMAVCAEEGVPVPDLIFETGRLPSARSRFEALQGGQDAPGR